MRPARLSLRLGGWLVLAAVLAAGVPARAQAPDFKGARSDSTKGKKAKAPKDSAKTPPPPRPAIRFYDDETPVPVTIRVNLGRLRNDKGEAPPWRGATISYAAEGGAPVTVPLRVRARGIWRRANCRFPPLRMNFARTADSSVFAGLDRPKLVSFCEDNDRSDGYILQEAQLYRILRLVTPISHRMRLIRLTYADSASGKTIATRWGFIMEDGPALAARLGGKLIEEPGASSEDLDGYSSALTGLFQYLIGNTDWSIGALHNTELVFADSSTHPVMYDFDYAGAVDAHYAAPSPKLPIRSVRQRLYRGYCATPAQYDRAVALFREKKEAIYALYAPTDPVGKLLDPKVARRTLDYYDDFFKKLDDPRAVKREIMDACLKLG